MSGGLAAVVDMASPLPVLRRNYSSLITLRTGPMVTARLGYPTQSWGAGNYQSTGYGWPVASGSPQDAVAVVRSLVNNHGADLIKLPVTAEPGGDYQLSAAALAAAVAG